MVFASCLSWHFLHKDVDPYPNERARGWTDEGHRVVFSNDSMYVMLNAARSLESNPEWIKFAVGIGIGVSDRPIFDTHGVVVASGATISSYSYFGFRRADGSIVT